MDARVKLVHIALFGLALFVARNDAAGMMLITSLAGFLVVLRLGACALTLLAYYGALVVLGMALGRVGAASGAGGGLLGLLGLVVFLLRKLAPALGLYYLFTRALSVAEILAALEAWRLPRKVSIALAVALRFFPTMGQEAAVIMDVMRLRGRPLNLVSLCRAPAEMLEYAFVPFLTRCVQIADELSASAVARGIECPGPRTSLRPLRLRARDGLYLGALALTSTAVLACALAL